MSAWQLALVAFGCWLLGACCGIAAVYVYARHVFRSKFGQLAGQLTGARPDRADSFQ